MDNRSNFSSFLKELQSHHKSALISDKYLQIFKTFYQEYAKAVGNSYSQTDTLFHRLLLLIEQQAKQPFTFAPFHQAIRTPFDYYQFGLDFINPLIDWEHSTLANIDILEDITLKIRNKENVVFFANHQTEADPQVISLLLEKRFPELAEEMIFVAGERVITDPLAIPFSLGCNLLCIYSKRYIDLPPEQKADKQRHNQKTMDLMSGLFKEGGKAIYVAPSGGRDRRNTRGDVEVAPFDPQSVAMFHLMAKRAKSPTHFYPMALKTYSLLPPPETVQIELGEHRSAQKAAVHLKVGSAISMQEIAPEEDKHLRRQKRAAYIHALVKNDYLSFP